MKSPAQTGLEGWQPLTPRGVAAFARASLKRLLLVQFVFAVLAAAAVAWLLSTGWFPTIRAAIHALPARGEIRSGRLDWAGDSPQLLAEGNFLALVVDLNHRGQVRSPAHLQVEFGRNTVRLFSLFGYLECGYPRGSSLALNRPALEPWWGAWEPPILWTTVAVTLAGLMVSWSLLATGYASAVWLIGFFANRALNPSASWKLAGAALMPGALLITAGILLYGLEVLDLVGFIAAVAAHFVTGWFYLLLSPFFAPRLRSRAVAEDNPFAAPPDGRAGPVAEELEPPPPPR
jgi:hypothetical protein